MKRNIGLERVFKLGDYKSMRITTDVFDIPEELALDEAFMSQVALLQLIEADRAFYQYRLQAAAMNDYESDGERYAALVEQEAQVYTNIQSRIEEIHSKEE